METPIYQQISVEEMKALSSLNFEGYLWYSHEKNPKLYPDETQDFNSILSQLPFVIEGKVYCAEEEISLQIQWLDGSYRIGKINMKLAKAEAEKNNLLLEKVTLPAHRMQSYQLKMCHAYENQEDPLNPGFTNWIPTWRAFVGIVK